DPIEYVIQVYDPDTQFTQDENDDKTGAPHIGNVVKSQIHVAADGTWVLRRNNTSGFVNGLIVTRASAIPDVPTLPSRGFLGQVANSGATLFGSVGSDPAGTPVSRTTQLADAEGRT